MFPDHGLIKLIDKPSCDLAIHEVFETPTDIVNLAALDGNQIMAK